MEKSGFVYIWRDRKHKRYYIGSHWGTEDDGYICSSRWMRQSYKRRPNDFKRRILVRNIKSKKELFEVEELYLKMIKPEELKSRYYNIMVTSSWHWFSDDHKTKTISEKISTTLTGRIQSEETKEKRRASIKSYWQNKGGPRSGKKWSPETREKMKSRVPWNKGIKTGKPSWSSGKKFGPHSVEMKEVYRQKSKEMWENRSSEEREIIGQKISDGLKNKPKSIVYTKYQYFIDNVEYKTLKEISKIYGVARQTVLRRTESPKYESWIKVLREKDK